MALRAFDGKQNGLTSRSIKNGAINPSKLARVGLSGYAIEPCKRQPRASTSLATAGGAAYGDPTGATGDVNLLHFSDLTMSYVVLGAGQTLLAPTIDTSNGGLLIGLDAVAAEGVEYVPGGMVTAHNPFAVVVGTSPNAFIRATLRAATVANVAELAVGWRKAEAFQALIDGYDEMAVLNMQAGNILRETILNNGTTASVDTTLNATNATNFTLEVRLIGRQALMLVNDAEAVIGAPFNFDATEVVIPFIHFLQGAGASTLHLVDLEVGPLYAAGVHDPQRK